MRFRGGGLDTGSVERVVGKPARFELRGLAEVMIH